MSYTNVLKALVFVAASLLAFGYFQWFDRFHLAIAAIVLAALLAIRLAMQAIRREEGEEEFLDELDTGGALPAILAGILLAAVFVGSAKLTFAAAAGVPLLQATLIDGDRVVFEAKLEKLTTDGDHFTAGKAIIERMQYQVSPAWKADLTERAFTLLAAAASHAPTLVDRSNALQYASELARRLDTELPLACRPAAAQLDADKQAQLAAQLALGNGDWLAFFAELQVVGKERPAVAWPREVAATFHDGLIRYAVAQSDPLEQHRFVEKAYRIAAVHDLETAEDELLLEQLRPAVTPRTLPAGARARIIATSQTGEPPSLTLDIDVRGPAEEFLRGLQKKDFVIMQGTNRLLHYDARPVAGASSGSSVVCAIGVSSQAGEAAFSSMLDGFSKYLSAISGQADVRILAFRDYVIVARDWTRDVRSAWYAIAGTRLAPRIHAVEAALSAIHSARKRGRGTRVLLAVIGQDTGNKSALAQAIRDARTAGVVIDVISFGTNARDTVDFRQLASATGGTFFPARTYAELVSCFQQTASSLRGEAYRLVIGGLTVGSGEEDLTVRIGAGHTLSVLTKTSLVPDPRLLTVSRF